MLSILIDKELFGVMKDILYVCAYVPPEGSPFYPYFDADNGIGLLEECLWVYAYFEWRLCNYGWWFEQNSQQFSD